MPNITVTYDRPSGELSGDSYDNARVLIEEEKDNYPHLIFSADPSWEESTTLLVATLPGKINPNYVAPEEPVEEPELEPEEEPEATSTTGSPLLDAGVTLLKNLFSSDDDEASDEEEAEPEAEVEEVPADEEPVEEEVAADEEAVAEPEEEVATCEAVKADDEVCGRDLPCQYHDE